MSYVISTIAFLSTTNQTRIDPPLTASAIMLNALTIDVEDQVVFQ